VKATVLIGDISLRCLCALRASAFDIALILKLGHYRIGTLN